MAAFTGNAPVYLSPVTPAELRLGIEVTANPGVLAKTRGRSHRTRVQDLWLASQAIQHSLGLVTRNPGDFADIPGLDVVHVGLPG